MQCEATRRVSIGKRVKSRHKATGTKRHPTLGAGLFDQFLKKALGLEDEFDCFADSASSGEGFSGVMGNPLHLGDGVADGQGKAGAAHERNIGEIIADKGYGGIGDARFLQDFFVGGHFERDLHVDEFHFHLVGAAKKCGAFAAGDTTSAETSGVSEGETLAVVGIESLDLQSAAVGLRKERDAAVGHGAVNVHKDDLDLGSAPFEDWRDLGGARQWFLRWVANL